MVTPEFKKLSVPIEEIDAQKELATLEKRLAEHIGAEFCVLTSSGTSGLLAALLAAGVSDGDTVMCTSFSFFATAEIITLAGGVPLLVDANPETFNVDAYCLEYVLKRCIRTECPIPKVLIASDLFGLPCDFDSIGEICDKYGVTIIEDMSCAFGAAYKGKKCGNFGRFSVASFFPARPLGDIGDGGGVFCRTREDAKLIEELRDSGKRQKTFDFVQVGIIGEKLSNFNTELARRQLVAARYRDNFKGFIKVQHTGEEYINAYTQFVIVLADFAQRERVIYAMKEKHIPCSILHYTQRVRTTENEWERVVLANTNQAAQRLLAIPIHPYLSVHVTDYISQSIIESVENPVLAT